MRHFFRLLFISFGLLLFLGINAHQSTGPLENELAASLSLDISDCQAVLAASATDASIPHLPFCSLTPKGQSNTKEQIELITSRELQSRLHFFVKRYREYSPGILYKKGITVKPVLQKGEISPA